MGMSCEQNIKIFENKVESEGPDIIPISDIYFLSDLDPDISRGVKNMQMHKMHKFAYLKNGQDA